MGNKVEMVYTTFDALKAGELFHPRNCGKLFMKIVLPDASNSAVLLETGQAYFVNSFEFVTPVDRCIVGVDRWRCK